MEHLLQEMVVCWPFLPCLACGVFLFVLVRPLARSLSPSLPLSPPSSSLFMSSFIPCLPPHPVLPPLIADVTKGSVSSDLEKTLIKATRPDNDPAKRKHVNLLLQAAEHSFPAYMDPKVSETQQQ